MIHVCGSLLRREGFGNKVFRPKRVCQTNSSAGTGRHMVVLANGTGEQFVSQPKYVKNVGTYIYPTPGKVSAACNSVIFS